MLHLARDASKTSVFTSARAIGILPVQRFDTVAGRKPTDFAAFVKFGTLFLKRGTFKRIDSMPFSSFLFRKLPDLATMHEHLYSHLQFE